MVNHHGLVDPAPGHELSADRAAVARLIGEMPAPTAAELSRWVTVLRGQGRRKRPAASFRTIRNYLSYAFLVIRHWQRHAVSPREITRQDVQAAVSGRTGEDAHHLIVALRSIFRALCQAGCLPAPVRALPRAVRQRPSQEVRIVLHAARGRRAHGPAHRRRARHPSRQARRVPEPRCPDGRSRDGHRHLPARHPGARRRCAERANGAGSAPGVVSQVAGRVVGFGLQMGPYAVAELRTADLLASYGAAPPAGGMSLYVTDTLDDYRAAQTYIAQALRIVAESRRKANEIKAAAEVTVVIGNPPYKELAVGEGGWVENGRLEHGGSARAILEDFYVQGAGRFKAKLKNLYVYFWRWATWKVWESTSGKPGGDDGIVCFISTSGYLTGPAFTGMREYLRRHASRGGSSTSPPKARPPTSPPASSPASANRSPSACSCAAPAPAAISPRSSATALSPGGSRTSSTPWPPSSSTSPITRASGKKKVVAARFVHNDRLVDALNAQAFAALGASPGARAYYDELRARDIEHNDALRRLANRLVGILHGCLKTGTLYDEATAWGHRENLPQSS